MSGADFSRQQTGLATSGARPSRTLADQPVPTSRSTLIITLVLAVVILLPSMAGFVNKFIEFFHATRQEADGAYVLTPMINYFLATCGFFCLLIWATLQGMFQDIEAPKQVMLMREAELDRNQILYTPAWAGERSAPRDSRTEGHS